MRSIRAHISMASNKRGAVRGAFSLIELLVVVSIMGTLASLLLSAAHGVREQARALQCKANMRSVAMNFQYFATNTNPEGRGDSDRLGSKRFHINDFQDMLYKLDEFWDLGNANTGEIDRGQQLTLCPSAPGRITKQKGFPCGRDAIQPLEAVSIAFNMRFFRGVLEFGGQKLLAPTQLSELHPDVLDHPFAPLAMDVDAKAAIANNHDPFYIAPSTPDPDDPYSNERFWFPSDRHGGQTIVSFVGGHVLSSATPAEEQWDWGYAAHIGK